MTCTIKFWRDMDGGTTCGKGGSKFAVTDGPGGPFLRGDQKFRDSALQWLLANNIYYRIDSDALALLPEDGNLTGLCSMTLESSDDGHEFNTEG